MRWRRIETNTTPAVLAGISMSALALHCALHTIADDAGFIAAPLLEVMRSYGCDDCEAFARVLTRSGRIGRADKRARQIMPGLVTELCSLGYLALSLDAGREGAELRSLDNKQPLRWDETEGRKRARDKRAPSPGVVAGDLPLADATTTSDASRASFVGTPEGHQRDTRGTPEGQDTVATPRNYSIASAQKRREEKREREGEDARARASATDNARGSLATEPHATPETIQPKRATSDEGSFVAAFARGAGRWWQVNETAASRAALEAFLREAVATLAEVEDFGQFAAEQLTTPPSTSHSGSRYDRNQPRAPKVLSSLSVFRLAFRVGDEWEFKRLSSALEAWREAGPKRALYRRELAAAMDEHAKATVYLNENRAAIETAARARWAEIQAAKTRGELVVGHLESESEHVENTLRTLSPATLPNERDLEALQRVRNDNRGRANQIARIVAGEPLPVRRLNHLQRQIASPEYAREAVERMRADRDERERERLREEDAQRTAAMASRGSTLAEQWQNLGANVAAQKAAKAAKAATAAPVETGHGGGGGDDPCDDERPDWGDLDSIENQANDRCDDAPETDDERELAPSTRATHEARSPNPVARLEAKLVSLEINKTDASAERLPIAPPAKVAR
jgi:hypothetical protein